MKSGDDTHIYLEAWFDTCNKRNDILVEKVPTQPPRDPDKRIAARIRRRAKLLSAFAELEKSAHQRVYSRRMGHLENLVSQDGCPLQHNRDKLEFFTVRKGREIADGTRWLHTTRGRISKCAPPCSTRFAFVLRPVSLSRKLLPLLCKLNPVSSFLKRIELKFILFYFVLIYLFYYYYYYYLYMYAFKQFEFKSLSNGCWKIDCSSSFSCILDIIN